MNKTLQQIFDELPKEVKEECPDQLVMLSIFRKKGEDVAVKPQLYKISVKGALDVFLEIIKQAI